MIRFKGTIARGLRIGNRLVKPGDTLGAGGDIELSAEDLKGFDGDEDFESVAEGETTAELKPAKASGDVDAHMVEVNGQVIRDRRRGDVK